MTAADRFGRVYSIELGKSGTGVKVESLDGRGRSLRVDFEVKRDDSTTPNRASLAIYNLNEDTRAQLTRLESLPCSISAGYQQTGPLQMFLGTLRRVYVERQGPDLILKADAGDGHEQVQTAKISKSFPKGTPWSSVVQDFAKRMDLDAVQDLTGGAIQGELVRGLAFQGDLAFQLTRLLRPFGCRWFIDSGVLVLQATDTEGVEGHVKIVNLLSPATINLKKDRATKQLEQLITFTTLLEPSIFPGSQFELGTESGASVTGKMLVRSVEHQGSTHEQAWLTKVECVQAGV